MWQGEAPDFLQCFTPFLVLAQAVICVRVLPSILHFWDYNQNLENPFLGFTLVAQNAPLHCFAAANVRQHCITHMVA